MSKYAIIIDSTYAFPTLERQLVEYVNNTNASAQPFDIQNVPKISKAQEEEERRRMRTQEISSMPSLSVPSSQAHPRSPGTPATPDSLGANSPAMGSSFDQQQAYAEQLTAISDFASFGALFKSSPKPIELTESETEYVIHCIKHTYKEHIVFQVRFHFST
jgi:coatomer protein complex subunit gamma